MNYGWRFMTFTGDRDQTIPLEKKCKKVKWLSGKALQIAVKRREAKNREGKIQASECRVPKNNKER